MGSEGNSARQLNGNTYGLHGLLYFPHTLHIQLMHQRGLVRPHPGQPTVGQPSEVAAHAAARLRGVRLFTAKERPVLGGGCGDIFPSSCYFVL